MRVGGGGKRKAGFNSIFFGKNRGERGQGTANRGMKKAPFLLSSEEKERRRESFRFPKKVKKKGWKRKGKGHLSIYKKRVKESFRRRVRKGGGNLMTWGEGGGGGLKSLKEKG